MEELTFTDYVDSGKKQNRFGQFSWAKNDHIYLDVNFEVFSKDDNNEFRLVENLKVGEADFNQFLRPRNQPVIAAENFAREKPCPQRYYQHFPKT